MTAILTASAPVPAQLADKTHLAALVAAEAFRRARRALRLGALRRWHFAASVPDTVAAVPTGLRHGDPRMAREFYAGRFRLAGRLAQTGGRSPFDIAAPSAEWAAELHGFEWLRHLAAAGDALAAANARALIFDWMSQSGAGGKGWGDNGTAARRLVSWLTHCDLLLGDADPVFARRFMRALMQHMRFLRQLAPEAADGLPRLGVRIALAYGALCLGLGGAQVRLAAKALSDELDRQVFPDGVHVSRNPAVAVTILADLLPLARLFDAANHPVPKSLVNAVDRLLPMLRFFRHADGALALFNGAGATESAVLTALLRHDETLGEPISHAPQGGYQRLSAAGTVLLVDAGAPPSHGFSGDAHAGTLAFEFSSPAGRFVVNCGVSPAAGRDARHLSRTTAAHSTLTLADHSSSRFRSAAPIERFLGAPLIGGPNHVSALREEIEGGTRLVAAHDGYRARFGLVHERTLFLARGGDRIEGVDRLLGRAHDDRGGRADAATVRFHLHPDVSVEWMGGALVLAARGERWRFEAGAPVAVEDSVFFASHAGPRRSSQIVVGLQAVERSAVVWRFSRIRA